MATYTQPSKTLIAQEALKICGYPSGGSSAQQTVAQEFIEECKMDIWNILNKYNIKLRCTLATAYEITTQYVFRYANPSDCDSIYSINLLDGDSGTATSVAAGSIDLEAGTATPVGKLIVLTSGTGKGNGSVCSSYSDPTATLTPGFSGSSFDGTEDYLIVNRSEDLIKGDIKQFDEKSDPYTTDEPTNWYPKGQAAADTDETGEFILYPNPDDTYALQIRYYVNIMLMDLTNDANLIGSLYRKFKPLFMQKVIYRQHQTDRNFEFAQVQEDRYWNKVEDFIRSEKDTGYSPVLKVEYY